MIANLPAQARSWLSPTRAIPEWAAVVLVLLVLLLPAIANGGPFLFYDSNEYFQVGQRIVGKLLEFLPLGSDAASAPGAIPAAAGQADPATGGGIAALAAARSPLYSSLLYGVSRLLGLWPIAILQSLVCAILIVRLVRFAWGDAAWPAMLAVALILSIGSGLGFYAAFIMPDVYAGCTALALALYLYARPKGRTGNALLLGGAFLMATTHTTIVFLALSAIIAAVMIALVERARLRPMLPRLGAVLAVAIAAWAANTAWPIAARILSGDDVRSVPYLTSRVIADGPGARYLEEVCTSRSEPWAACAFAGATNSDIVLWGGGESFSTADADLRGALADEQMRFVRAVLAAHPWEQAVASVANFASQLRLASVHEIDFGLSAFVRDDHWRKADILAVVPQAGACLADVSRCARPPLAEAWITTAGLVNGLALPAFLVLALWLATMGRPAMATASAKTADLMRIAAFFALLALANAAICGVVSGAYDRYQARLVWTLVLSLTALAPILHRAVRTAGVARLGGEPERTR